MTELYDAIGGRYRQFRRPDSRIGDVIVRGLAEASSVANVGAGAGSYEPRDRRVVAVEPSMTMIRQRPPASAPVVRASGTAIPFRDEVVDASLAILSHHHWPDQAKGLRELRRVARRRVVVLTWDPAAPGFWLTDYFPEILRIDRLIFPSLETFRRELGRTTVLDVPIPHDCSDGFLGAYWRRPAAYLDASVRSAISTFAKLGNLEDGVSRLARDLESGEWRRRHGSILARESLDLGYRLVVSA
jgi:SAM-dependent methyltransferase